MIVSVLACAAVILGLQLLTPFWWWVMIVPFAFGFAVSRTGGRAAGLGFLGAGLPWLGGAIFFMLTGSGIVASRMAGMLGLGGAWWTAVAAGLMAAVAGGISGYAGWAVRALVIRPVESSSSGRL